MRAMLSRLNLIFYYNTNRYYIIILYATGTVNDLPVHPVLGNMWGFILLSFILATTVNLQDTSIEELLAVIEKYNYTISNYAAPEDASVYFENLNTTIEEHGTYDFIVIGAGPGGTVISNRLTENNDWNVLLLEAGGYGDHFTDIPESSSALLNTSYNWGYYTVPQQFACLGSDNHRCSVPRGRGVGGTSLINYLMYSRGTGADWDRLAKQIQDLSWSFDNVLPFFKKSENFVVRDPLSPVDLAYHSTGGYHTVEQPLPRNIILDTFLASNEELGWPIIDYNNRIGLGASPVQFNTRNGKRLDDGTGFIKPILYRNNLDVSTHSYVTKILIDKNTKKAEGVSFVRHGKSYVAYASKEVILCAGTIGSPQLLMLSGVGPKDHLESLDIPVLQDLEVGSSFQDHIGFHTTFNVNCTLNNQTYQEMLGDYLKGYGVLTTALGIRGLGFYPSMYGSGSENGDIEIFPYKFVGYNNFGLIIINEHTKSVGTLRLKSNNPAAYPLIDPRYLSDENDLRVMYEGVELSLNLSRTEAFQKLGAKLSLKEIAQCSSHEYLSKEYWLCAIQYTQLACLHPVGTCPMGPDPTQGAVVDSSGKVFGINKLRVCDASIFPFSMSGHPHAQVLMAAEKIANIIKAHYL